MFNDEIENIDIIGYIKDEAVKLVKTIGGLYIALVQKGKDFDILTSASHPAIVKYFLSKNKNFKPLLAKSTSALNYGIAENYSYLVPQEYALKGYGLFGIPEGTNDYRFVLTLMNLKKCEVLIKKDGYDRVISALLDKHKSNLKERDILLNSLKLMYKILES